MTAAYRRVLRRAAAAARSMHPFQWYVVVFTAVASVAIGWVVEDARSESDRIRAAVLQGIVADQERQARKQSQQEITAQRDRAGRCARWYRESSVDVTPQTTAIGRTLVQLAAADYQRDGCEMVTGKPLPPVDPEAYRPAPANP